MAVSPWELDWSTASAASAGEVAPWNRDWSDTPAKPVEGGFVAAAKSTVGSTIKGAGQAAADFVPGVDNDNPVKRYGQRVVDANPTAVHELSDVIDKPWTTVKEAVGQVVPPVVGLVAARAAGTAITAAAPLTGPFAPAVALAGQVVSWLGPLAVAALPSFSSIRDKQIVNDPTNEESAQAKAVAALGAGAVAAIETKFGPQQWAMAAFTKEGRAALAEKFAATTMPRAVAKAAAKGAAIEGAEEIAQQPIEQLASGDNPLTPASLKETAFSGVMGAIGGGVLGGAAGAITHTSPKQKTPEPPADILDATSVDSAIEAFKFDLSKDRPGIDLAAIAATYKDATPDEIVANQKSLVAAFESDPTFAPDAEGLPTAYGARLKAIAPQELPPHTEDMKGLSRDAYEALAAINTASGLRTVVFDDHDDLPDGLVNQPGVVFLSNRSSIDPAVVAAHEVQHLSEQGEKQAAYAKAVEEQLAGNALVIARQRHGDLATPKLMAEIRADIAGDAMTDPQFHSRVIDAMTSQLGEKASEANAVTLLDSIKNMIARIRQTLTGTTFTTSEGKRIASEYVRSLEEVHQALAAAIADRFLQQGYRPPGAQVNTSQLLVQRALAMQEARVAAENTPFPERTLAQNKLLAAPPITAPKGSSPALKSAIAAAQRAPFDRDVADRLNLEAIKAGLRMSRKAPEGVVTAPPRTKAKLELLRAKSPEFRRWFGKSRVVDKKGTPLIIYHGTAHDFEVPRGRFWASDSPAVAESFAEFSTGEAPAIIPGYLSMTNPLVVDAEALGADSIPFDGAKRSTDEIATLAEKSGRDGVIFLNLFDSMETDGSDSPSTVYVVFKPQQVKSAYNEKPTSKPGLSHSPKSDRAKLAAIRKGVLVNIGLNVGDKQAVSRTQAISALKLAGVKVLSSSIHQSDTEQTLVAKLDRALTPDEAHAVSQNLQQDAIAQVENGKGEIYGPKAEAWRPFNPEYFLTPDGTRLTEAKQQTQFQAALARASRYLLPEEKAKLRTDTAKRFVDLIGQMPSAQEMASVALAGKAKRGWYRHSAEALVHVFAADAPRFAVLLAAMSPQTSVENNLLNTLNAWKNWTTAGRPVEREKILEILGRSVQGVKGEDSVLDAWINNSVRALTAADPAAITLSGPKVNSFYSNLIGNTNEVTNDAWMANYAYVDQKIFAGSLNAAGNDPGKGPGYLAMSSLVRKAAAVLTKLTGSVWTPAEVQETIWSWSKAAYELADSKDEKRSVAELVKNGEITDTLINATPDFRTLFHDQTYQRILEDAGYGSQVHSLVAPEWNHGAARVQEPGAQGQAGTVAPNPRHLAAAARRLDRLHDDRRNGEVNGQQAPNTPAGAASDTGGARGAAGDGRADGRSESPVALSPKQGRLDLVGVHFSSQPREVINGAFFGTGMKGAEVERVMSAPDLRLRSRVYAYINDGTGVRPEKYVGGQAHVVRMDNIYDADSDHLSLAGREDNAFESAVLDAGFDGYYIRAYNVAVLLGEASSAVPAENRGTGYRGADLPVPPARTYTPGQLRAQEIVNDRSLPAGKMTGADWRAALGDRTPAGVQDEKLYYRNEVAKLAITSPPPARAQLSPKAEDTPGYKADRRNKVAPTSEQLHKAEVDGVFPPQLVADYRAAVSEYNRLRGKIAPLRDELERSERRRTPFGGPLSRKQSEREIELFDLIAPMSKQLNEIRERRDALNAQRYELLEQSNISLSPKIVGASKRPYTAEQKRFFEHTGRTIDQPSIADRLKAMRKDLGRKLSQGLVDQFAPLKELSPMAYMLARLSKGSAGALEALLRHGKLSLKNGAYDADRTGGFVDLVGKPLQGETEDFLWWVAANRAENLTAQDRERLFSRSDIAAGKSLSSGTTTFDYKLQHGPNAGTTTQDRKAIFADALQTFDEFNKNTLDMAEQSGLIDPAARKIWEQEFYVPFYRVSEEDGGFIGAKMNNALVRQRAFKKLKGGEEKLNSDLLANTLANWAHLIDASAKNRAAKSALESAATMGVAVEADAATVKAMGRSIGKKNSTVWFMDNGVERHFLVDDPFVLTAITSLEFAGMHNPVMDAMSTMKHVLTVGVTANPIFKINNLIRDSLQAIATAPLGYNVIANVKEGIAASEHSTQTYVSALASGGLVRFGTMLEGRMSDQVRQLVKSGIKESTILNSDSKLRAMYDKFIDPAVTAYNELGNRSEEINRAALFKQLTDNGMDHAQAALMARDLMDFSLQGSWTAVRFLTQVVPFLNARMQGIYKLGRATQEDPRRVAAVLGATALFSIALMAAYADDDDWKKREDFDRNSFWFFKVGGTAFRIPKPFELGAIATLAERGVEYFTEKEMTGERFRDQVLHLLKDNLAMNPVPQLFKPIVDLYANRDSFTGRPLETLGMEHLQPDYRFTSRTSMVARAASTAGQAVASTVGGNFVSPVKIDHALRGYFGWLGGFVVGTADVIVRPMTNEPERPAGDMWKTATGNLISELPADQSRYISRFYEQGKIIEEAYGTYRSLAKQGRTEEAREFLEDNRDKILKYQSTERVKKAESQLGERVRILERSSLDPEAKKIAISAVHAQRDRIARLVN